VNHEDLKKYLEEYSISLGKSAEDPTVETRGVMVIKSKSKTKARQRKGALANWKVRTPFYPKNYNILILPYSQRVGRVTIKELHKRNMTGEELNKIMWGRSDIATPVRQLPDDLEDGDINLMATDALSSALDTMAFAADLPMGGSGPTTAPPANIGMHKGSAPPCKFLSL
jgi:transient receptor potential cation channel subfamily V member 6